MDKDKFRELLQSFEQLSVKPEAGGTGCDGELDGVISRTVAAASEVWPSSRRSSYSPQQAKQTRTEPKEAPIDGFLATVLDNGTSFPELEATHPLPEGNKYFSPSSILKSTDASECRGVEGMRVQQQLHTASRFRLTAGILAQLWFQVTGITKDMYVSRAVRERLEAIDEDLVALCSATLVEAGQLEGRAQEALALESGASSGSVTAVPDDSSFGGSPPSGDLNIVISANNDDMTPTETQQPHVASAPATVAVFNQQTERETGGTEEEAAEIPLGARISRHAEAWKAMTDDAWVVGTASEGLRFDFSATPEPVAEQTEPEYAVEESAAIEAVIRWDLGDKVIEAVAEQADQYVSHMYTLRIAGKLKALVDFRMLNKFLDASTIGVAETPSLYSQLRKSDWITRISIKCAYPSVPIHRDHRRFLVFRYKSNCYQYRALPFGISVASRVFTKLLQAALQPLRDEGFRITSHIDEICLLSSSYQELTERTKRLCRHLAELGFLVNMATSDLVPQQNQRFLGFVFNTVDSIVHFPKDQIKKVRRAAHTARSSAITAKQLASLLGKVRSIMPAIGTVRWRILEIEKSLDCSITNPESWDDVVQLSPSALDEINWLCDNILVQKSMPISNDQ